MLRRTTSNVANNTEPRRQQPREHPKNDNSNPRNKQNEDDDEEATQGTWAQDDMVMVFKATPRSSSSSPRRPIQRQKSNTSASATSSSQPPSHSPPTPTPRNSRSTTTSPTSRRSSRPGSLYQSRTQDSIGDFCEVYIVNSASSGGDTFLSHHRRRWSTVSSPGRRRGDKLTVQTSSSSLRSTQSSSVKSNAISKQRATTTTTTTSASHHGSNAKASRLVPGHHHHHHNHRDVSNDVEQREPSEPSSRTTTSHPPRREPNDHRTKKLAGSAKKLKSSVSQTSHTNNKRCPTPVIISPGSNHNNDNHHSHDTAVRPERDGNGHRHQQQQQEEEPRQLKKQEDGEEEGPERKATNRTTETAIPAATATKNPTSTTASWRRKALSPSKTRQKKLYFDPVLIPGEGKETTKKGTDTTKKQEAPITTVSSSTVVAAAPPTAVTTPPPPPSPDLKKSSNGKSSVQQQQPQQKPQRMREASHLEPEPSHHSHVGGNRSSTTSFKVRPHRHLSESNTIVERQDYYDDPNNNNEATGLAIHPSISSDGTTLSTGDVLFLNPIMAQLVMEDWVDTIHDFFHDAAGQTCSADTRQTNAAAAAATKTTTTTTTVTTCNSLLLAEHNNSSSGNQMEHDTLHETVVSNDEAPAAKPNQTDGRQANHWDVSALIPEFSAHDANAEQKINHFFSSVAGLQEASSLSSSQEPYPPSSRQSKDGSKPSSTAAGIDKNKATTAAEEKVQEGADEENFDHVLVAQEAFAVQEEAMLFEQDSAASTQSTFPDACTDDGTTNQLKRLFAGLGLWKSSDNSAPTNRTRSWIDAKEIRSYGMNLVDPDESTLATITEEEAVSLSAYSSASSGSKSRKRRTLPSGAKNKMDTSVDMDHLLKGIEAELGQISMQIAKSPDSEPTSSNATAESNEQALKPSEESQCVAESTGHTNTLTQTTKNSNQSKDKATSHSQKKDEPKKLDIDSIHKKEKRKWFSIKGKTKQFDLSSQVNTPGSTINDELGDSRGPIATTTHSEAILPSAAVIDSHFKENRELKKQLLKPSEESKSVAMPIEQAHESTRTPTVEKSRKQSNEMAATASPTHEGGDKPGESAFHKEENGASMSSNRECTMSAPSCSEYKRVEGPSHIRTETLQPASSKKFDTTATMQDSTAVKKKKSHRFFSVARLRKTERRRSEHKQTQANETHAKEYSEKEERMASEQLRGENVSAGSPNRDQQAEYARHSSAEKEDTAEEGADSKETKEENTANTLKSNRLLVINNQEKSDIQQQSEHQTRQQVTGKTNNKKSKKDSGAASDALTYSGDDDQDATNASITKDSSSKSAVVEGEGQMMVEHEGKPEKSEVAKEAVLQPIKNVKPTVNMENSRLATETESKLFEVGSRRAAKLQSFLNDETRQEATTALEPDSHKKAEGVQNSTDKALSSKQYSRLFEAGKRLKINRRSLSSDNEKSHTQMDSVEDEEIPKLQQNISIDCDSSHLQCKIRRSIKEASTKDTDTREDSLDQAPSTVSSCATEHSTKMTSTSNFPTEKEVSKPKEEADSKRGHENTDRTTTKKGIFARKPGFSSVHNFFQPKAHLHGHDEPVRTSSVGVESKPFSVIATKYEREVIEPEEANISRPRAQHDAKKDFNQRSSVGDQLHLSGIATKSVNSAKEAIRLCLPDGILNPEIPSTNILADQTILPQNDNATSQEQCVSKVCVECKDGESSLGDSVLVRSECLKDDIASEEALVAINEKIAAQQQPSGGEILFASVNSVGQTAKRRVNGFTSWRSGLPSLLPENEGISFDEKTVEQDNSQDKSDDNEEDEEPDDNDEDEDSDEDVDSDEDEDSDEEDEDEEDDQNKEDNEDDQNKVGDEDDQNKEDDQDEENEEESEITENENDEEEEESEYSTRSSQSLSSNDKSSSSLAEEYTPTRSEGVFSETWLATKKFFEGYAKI